MNPTEPSPDFPETTLGIPYHASRFEKDCIEDIRTEMSIEQGRNWKWSFESDLNCKPLYYQSLPQNYQESNRLSLMCILFRHSALAALGNNLEEEKSEQRISQHKKLFEFLFKNRPFNDVKFLDPSQSSCRVFSAQRLIKKTQSQKSYTKQEVYILTDCFQHFCSYQDSRWILDEVKSLLQQKIPKDQLDSEEATKEEKVGMEETRHLESITKEALKKVEGKIKELNKESFFFIKVQLESLSELIFPTEDLKNQDRDEIKEIVQEIYHNIRNILETYPKGIFDLVKDSIEPLLKEDLPDPWELWTNLLGYYYSCIRSLNRYMPSQLAHAFDRTTRSFLNMLLEHPYSFLASKKILQVDWELVDSILQKYLEMEESHKEAQKSEFSDRFFTSNIVTIAFSANLQFECLSPGNKQPEFMPIVIPLALDDSRMFDNCHIQTKGDKEFIKKMLERGVMALCNKIQKETKLETTKEKGLNFMKIKEINLHLYFSRKNNEMFKDEGMKMIMETFSRIEKALEEKNLLTQDQIEKKDSIEKNCNFCFSIEEKQPDLPESQNEIKFNQTKMSFFDYDFLENVILKSKTQRFQRFDTPVVFFASSKEFKENEPIEQLRKAAKSTNKFNQEQNSAGNTAIIIIQQ